jgi:hypothetical protein
VAERLGHGRVEEAAARGKQPAIRDVSNAIVRELELVPHGP